MHFEHSLLTADFWYFEPWYFDPLVFWPFGILTLWYFDPLVLWILGILTLLYFDSLVFWPSYFVTGILHCGILMAIFCPPVFGLFGILTRVFCLPESTGRNVGHNIGHCYELHLIIMPTQNIMYWSSCIIWASKILNHSYGSIVCVCGIMLLYIKMSEFEVDASYNYNITTKMLIL